MRHKTLQSQFGVSPATTLSIIRVLVCTAAIFVVTACSLQPRAILGSADAQYRLGMKYLVTTPPDYEKAEYWLRRAAIQGDPKAQKQLGRFYALGLGGTLMLCGPTSGCRWLPCLTGKRSTTASYWLVP
jgi:hypothetical protein